MIEIHLDGKPVTKLQAARALNQVDSGNHVRIGERNNRGWVDEDVYLRARHSAYGDVQPPVLGCTSFHADTLAEMRQQAEMIAIAAEIRELADMLAAEQVAEFTSDSRLTPARCEKPGEHGRNLAGAVVDCDIAAHHEPAPSPEGNCPKCGAKLRIKMSGVECSACDWWNCA